MVIGIKGQISKAALEKLKQSIENKSWLLNKVTLSQISKSILRSILIT
jgi:hypothetical protein